MVTRAVSDRCQTGVRLGCRTGVRRVSDGCQTRVSDSGVGLVSDGCQTGVRHQSDTAAKQRSTRRLQVRAFPWRAALQELDEQRADPLGLLLLDPVPGA